jgi:hypothetical protein
MSYPEMIKIKQQLDEIKIPDLDSHITAELDKMLRLVWEVEVSRILCPSSRLW